MSCDKQDHLLITCDELKLSHIQSVLSKQCGATSIFLGTTRDNFRGKKVLQLDYECYEEMAEKEMKKICKTLRDKFPNLFHIMIHHRLGSVPMMETSIMVATSSPHRKDAIEATQLCVDLVKSNVPIWKKELYEDGSSAWMSNKECCWAETDK